MSQFHPMRELPASPLFQSGDVLVLFGELFSRGYANGIVEEAQAKGMKVVFSTVGRRDEVGELRPLTEEEIEEKQTTPLINVPIEAGFDMTPSSKGVTPCDQLKGLKLNEWQTASLDWEQVEQSRATGIESFRSRVKQWVDEVDKQIPSGANVVFAHLMAGGVPRAKIIMPAMNRVFKGFGDRYASSEEFWRSDLGRLCDMSFMEVTANTMTHLVDLTQPLKEKIESNGGRVSYTAYGYHGTEVLVGDEYQWQSYSPYLQGFAKIALENIAETSWKSGTKVTVFNAPEILTNSSSVFLGIEVPLYPLLGALKKEGKGNAKVQKILADCQALLKDSVTIDSINEYAKGYFNSEVIQKWSNFEAWPQHNGPEQMEKIKISSTELINMHKDDKNMITQILSEVIFEACGQIMLAEAWQPRSPVWWIGHDAVAKSLNQN